MRETGSIGDKLLPKIVHAVSQAIISTKRSLAPLDHHVRYKAIQDVIDKIGHEVAQHYGPFVDLLLEQDTTGMHPAVVQWLHDSKSGQDQLKAVSGLLLGAGQSAIGTFLSNELAPAVYLLVASNPHLNLDPNTAAQAAAQGIVSEDNARATARGQGYDSPEFQTLLNLAFSFPAVSDALEMHRRGNITEGDLRVLLKRNAIPDQWADQIIALTANELSLADAALAYLRSDIDLQTAQQIAAKNGYNAEQFDIFLGNIGEPLGEQQLAEALRRGFIDQGTFERGIKQSRIRNEWIPTALALRYTPMSVADAVNAAVQNHISLQAAASIADQNGLEASAFPVLYETAGEPLSRTELEQLYNRGLIPLSVVAQGLRESRLKDKYIEDAEALHERLLEPRMLSSAVEVGAITHDAAVAEALKYGFSEANAQVLVNEGSARKLKTYRERVVSAAEGLYEENAISQDEFLSIAQQMGFDPAEADFVYQSAEYRRQAKAVTSAVNAVRSKYIAHHISHNDASGYLDSLGVTSDRRDYLLSLWDIEAAANVRLLTPAQVIKAVKLNLIPATADDSTAWIAAQTGTPKPLTAPEDGQSRLVSYGYSDEDALLLLEGA